LTFQYGAAQGVEAVLWSISAFFASISSVRQQFSFLKVLDEQYGLPVKPFKKVTLHGIVETFKK
jgi:hypothetical protein